jgi:hypothetical protein
MAESFSSRWWYGIILIVVSPVIYVAQWLVLKAVVPPSEDAPFQFVTGWLVIFLTWWLSVGAVLVFVVCLFMDARAVRSGDLDWKPNQYLYGLVGLPHLIALLVPFAYAISIPIGFFYLYRRHQHVGIP